MRTLDDLERALTKTDGAGAAQRVVKALREGKEPLFYMTRGWSPRQNPPTPLNPSEIEALAQNLKLPPPDTKPQQSQSPKKA